MKYVILIGLILFLLGIAFIPLELNHVMEFKGYEGEHKFTAKEYSNFKSAVIDFSTNPYYSFRYITVLDSHEPILVHYSWLPVQDGFPYGNKILRTHDGTPFDILKPIFIIIGVILAIVGSGIYSDNIKRNNNKGISLMCSMPLLSHWDIFRNL